MVTIKLGYCPQAEDTSIETDMFEFALLRQRTNSDRALMSAAHTRSTRKLSMSGLKHRFPQIVGEAFAQKVAQSFLGEHCPPNFFTATHEMTWIQDSIALAAILHEVFEQVQIHYYITGGVASSTFGDPRATRDLNVVLAVAPLQLEQLVIALEVHQFYVPGVEDVRSGRMKTLGVTHQPTISRADLMMAGSEEFDLVKFKRRKLVEVIGAGAFYFASPEDVVLNKLHWRQQSQSDKQWRDVLGVLKVQGDTLDFDYLGEWSRQLGIETDLFQALMEAGL